MLSTRIPGLACAVIVFVCLLAAPPLPRTATQLPLVAMVGTLALLSAATLWYWRTRVR
jgi:hypothetical protein